LLIPAVIEVKNVTITLDERTAAWVRVYAAKNDMSVSRIVGELLRERMHEQHDYDSAMRRYLGKAPVKLKRKGHHYPAREALHDRSSLR
jgi:hypothetical protein